MDHGHSSSSSSPSPPPSKQKSRPKIKGIEESAQVHAEGEDDIWPEEVEMHFQEALKIYPPIGRRKLLENGKMYGRNELIAKYIFMKTGKLRTRKQVSSHIQVLGKKSKKLQEGSLPPSTKITTTSPTLNPKDRSPDPPKLSSAPSSSSSSSSASSSSAAASSSSLHHQINPQILSRPTSYQIPPSPYAPPQTNNFAPFVPKPMMPAFPASASTLPVPGPVLAEPYQFRPAPINIVHHDEYALRPFGSFSQYTEVPNTPDQESFPASLRDLFVFLRFFSASLEHANGTLSGLVSRHHFVSLQSADFSQIYGDIPIDKVERNFFGLRELFDRSNSPCFFYVKSFANVGTSHGYGLHALHVKYQSRRRMTLKCSTTVYSFGQAVVEKIQVEDPIIEQTYYSYYFNHSPMCDYMVQFIETLKSLNDISKMNRVLSNFSVLQVIIDTESNATLMSTALVFEIANDATIRNEVYKLVPPK